MRNGVLSIRIENLTVKYQATPVLDHFSLTLPSTGCVCFFGPSGSGKTTLLQAIAGLIKPSEGKVLLQWTDPDPALHRISYVFQENRLVPWLTALENVSLVLLDVDPAERVEANETAKKCLADVGLEDALDKYPSQLSGGMRQRVNIARALAFDAPVVLLDEPFKELDDTIKSQIIALFMEMKKDRLILLVTHDKEDASLLADRIIPVFRTV